MAKPIFNTCICRQSLRTGSIIAGVGAILLSILFIIAMFVLRFKPKTILIDTLPPLIVKIIIAFNLCMTILISIIMIVGAMKVGFCSIFSIANYYKMLKLNFVAKPLSHVALGRSWMYSGSWIPFIDLLYCISVHCA